MHLKLLDCPLYSGRLFLFCFKCREPVSHDANCLGPAAPGKLTHRAPFLSVCGHLYAKPGGIALARIAHNSAGKGQVTNLSNPRAFHAGKLKSGQRWCRVCYFGYTAITYREWKIPKTRTKRKGTLEWLAALQPRQRCFPSL